MAVVVGVADVVVVVADEVEVSDDLVDDAVAGDELVVEASCEEQLASTSALTNRTRLVTYIAVDRTHRRVPSLRGGERRGRVSSRFVVR